jgi:hypothetical protein
MTAAPDRLLARLHASPLLTRFTAFTRVLLALGFIPPGLKKVLGERFTQLSVESPVGFFFEAFYQAHGWYVLVGIAQVLAAVLLLVPRTAHLGALLFLPIIANIVAITWSIDFAGTKYLTVLMLLAVVYLLAWDYDRLKALLPTGRRAGRGRSVRGLLIEAAAWGVAGGAAFFALTLVMNAAGLATLGAPAAVLARTGLVALLGTVFGLILALHLRAMPAAASEPTA